MTPEQNTATLIRLAIHTLGNDYPATRAKLAGIADYLESCAEHGEQITAASVEHVGYRPMRT